jgi:D-alanyl-D-alanine carboxypeptidase
LQLRDTEIGGKAAANPDQAFSYAYKGEWVQESETDMSIPLGAGALVSTPKDLTAFIEGLFSGKIISPASLAMMQEMKENYGRGMFVIPFYDKKSYGHTGGIDEFKAMLSYFPEDKLGFAMAVNASVIDPNLAAIAVLSAFFGRDYAIPTFKSIGDVRLLDVFAGKYGSPSFPLEITISKAGDGLTLQATGQPSIGLDYEDGNVFSYKRAGLELEFFPETESMTLKQGGSEHKFSKKK